VYVLLERPIWLNPGSMNTEDRVPNPLSRQDAAALIGILTTLEGELVAGDVADELLRTLVRSMRNDGVLPAGWEDRAGLRKALSDLNQRVRYTLGEYEELPEPDDGMVHHYVGFDEATGAEAFIEGMTELGLPAQQIRSDPAEPEPVQVMVSTGEILLSRAFDRRDEQIRAVAHQTGGHYIGWGGAPPGLS
jgi:Regulator of ribonuclease activity B